MERPRARTYQHHLRARSSPDWRMATPRWSFRKRPLADRDHCRCRPSVCRGRKLRAPSKRLDKVETRTCEIQRRIEPPFHLDRAMHFIFFCDSPHAFKGSLALLETRWNNPAMIIGDRLREMREEKKLSQGDIEKRSGLFRCYISRVENGHTVPAIGTLEKNGSRFRGPTLSTLLRRRGAA